MLLCAEYFVVLVLWFTVTDSCKHLTKDEIYECFNILMPDTDVQIAGCEKNVRMFYDKRG